MKTKKLPGGMGVLRIDTDKAERLVAAISMRYVTRVGILGEKTAREGKTVGVDQKTNAEIGLKHEKGSISERIPRRSFLEVPLVQNAVELVGPKNRLQAWIQKAVAGGKSEKECWKEAYKDLGHLAEQIVQRAFEQSGPGWPPNSAMTIALKGSDKPLIDTEQLRRSIMSKVVER